MLDLVREEPSLTARRHELASRIAEVTDVLGRLRQELNAVESALGSASQPANRPQPFKPVTYLKCVAEGHDFMNSRAMPGYVTCRRCRVRRRP